MPKSSVKGQKVIGCIPSRYASTRLPGKPLCDIGGKPMILHVIERAKKAKRLHDVVVLTDDTRIFKVVTNAGHSAAMTSVNCANGTERIADYLKTVEDGACFVNIQGDEVLLDATHVDALIDDFLADPESEMATLAHWVSDPETLKNPTTAKVVTDLQGMALYFSRNCIPVTQQGALPEKALVQIGVYIYSRSALLRLSSLTQTFLEETEKLEQLRALANGIRIGVTIVEQHQSLSVDTAADLEKARALFAASHL